MDMPPDVSRETLQHFLDDSPFQKVLGLRLESFDPTAQTLTLRSVYGPQVERSTGSGQYHGGVISALIDVAGDFALIAILGYGVPTINLRIDYLRPALNDDLLATALVRRAGRSIGVVDIEVKDVSGRLIALGRGCYGTQKG
jgi:uncharacterized protein (TIGR00369 family)